MVVLQRQANRIIQRDALRRSVSSRRRCRRAHRKLCQVLTGSPRRQGQQRYGPCRALLHDALLDLPKMGVVQSRVTLRRKFMRGEMIYRMGGARGEILVATVVV